MCFRFLRQDSWDKPQLQFTQMLDGATLWQQVDPSYLLGFDGAAWDGSALKWHFSHWQPQTLRARGPGGAQIIRESLRN